MSKFSQLLYSHFLFYRQIFVLSRQTTRRQQRQQRDTMTVIPTIAKALTKDLTKSFFKDIKTVLFDADGVLWEGPKAIPGEREHLAM